VFRDIGIIVGVNSLVAFYIICTWYLERKKITYYYLTCKKK